MSDIHGLFAAASQVESIESVHVRKKKLTDVFIKDLKLYLILSPDNQTIAVY